MTNQELLKLFRQQDRYLKFNEFIDNLPTEEEEECSTLQTNILEPTSETTTENDLTKSSSSQEEVLLPIESSMDNLSSMSSTLNETQEEDSTVNAL